LRIQKEGTESRIEPVWSQKQDIFRKAKSAVLLPPAGLLIHTTGNGSQPAPEMLKHIKHSGAGGGTCNLRTELIEHTSDHSLHIPRSAGWQNVYKTGGQGVV
jgi:hypothetical protein